MKTESIIAFDPPPWATGPLSFGRINFILTNRCNLRCVYCPQGSHPDDYHADMSAGALDEIVDFVREHGFSDVGLGYYGEFTMIEGWWRTAQRLLDMGLAVSCTTNGALPLSPDEVATLARFRYIEISIDTHEVELLKRVRKKVDARTILHNFHLIRSHCLRYGPPQPEIVWSGVLTRHVVETLPGFVAFAASNGVAVINFNEVGIYDGAPEKGLNIVDLDGERFEQAVALIDEATALAKRLQVRLTIAEAAKIRAKQEALRDGAVFGAPLAKRSTPIAEHWGHNEGNDVPPGHTRACTSPWTEFYLDPKGQIFSCCARGDVMGIARTKDEIAAVLANGKYAELRRSLATGENLDAACATCTVRPVIPAVPAQIETKAPPHEREAKPVSRPRLRSAAFWRQLFSLEGD